MNPATGLPCPEGNIDINSGKQSSIVLRFGQIFVISGHPGLYRGLKYHQIAAIGWQNSTHMTVYAGREKTQVLIKVRIIVWNLKNDDRKYATIYPVRAPFFVFRKAF
jgi:hypothetical protein